MFYRPEDGHGLPHNPFNALITPRPIGWISTRDEDGNANLAPYSFFNAVAYVPPQVMFASTSAKPDRAKGKDSLDNISQTGVFCVNIVSYALRDQMNATSGAFGREVDEFERAGLTKAPCKTIACDRVAEAPATMECKLTQIVELKGVANFIAIGEVTGIHISDAILKNGMIDPLAFQPLARMGYRDYSHVTDIFTLERPEV